MIEIKNLSKSYGKTAALKNLNLTVASGSTFGLVGINGAGKSTLLRLLSGVFKADCGSIAIDGAEIYENERKKREIFFLPDEPFYAPGMTGQKIAELYKTFYEFDSDIFDKYIKIYGLNVKTPVRNFSKGMKRQLFVCMAFAVKPKYLFLDEVFDGLDPFARLTFKRGLIEMSETAGTTTIIASHSLRELEDICDSYGLIDGHAVTQSGNIADSLDKLFKFQIALNYELTRENLGFDCLSFESSGRVAKIIVSGDKADYLEKIDRLHPILVDELKVDFEELFISEVKSKEAQLEKLK